MKALIVDYGVGNLFSLKHALEELGLEVSIGLEVEGKDLVFLPGVGSFTSASKRLGLVKDAILKGVEEGLGLFGICLGMQLLFRGSEEGAGEGLGLFEGSVRRFPKGLKVPHMGWNTISILKEGELLDGIRDGSWFYFAHSYYCDTRDHVLAESYYGVRFASVIEKGKVVGTQFHPERSGPDGRRLLRNFVRMCKR
ncbi:MAG: imidazole glycerol phosphate synthase subunit HisH [Thaumarchaeota archaeon]|nr:imidazole glycerol phosphate synthase subunit HisH [Nitrososphaerota archaeon]